MLEVERKFTVPPDFVVPELAMHGWAVAPETTVVLDATYYDTEDLRLARAHITLRRRVGGSDAGWHLKLPAGRDREEIQRPLGRGATVPPALADLVLAHTRGLPLAPVAHIHTTRVLTTISDPDGTPLVEVADDHVEGQRLGEPLKATCWREIEVELLTAGREKALAAVGKRLRTAGATPSTSASKLAQTLGRPDSGGARPPATGDRRSAAAAVTAYLREQVQALLAADPRVRRDEDDAVHAMRVASRRLRSALRTFRPLLDHSALGDLGSELKWLASVLGEVRDREVLHERMRHALDNLPDELVLGPVRARLLDEELHAGGLRARSVAVDALRSSRYLTLLDRLDGLAAAPPLTPRAARPAGTVLPRLAQRAWKRLRRRAARAIATGDEDRLHDCRKAAKQARYTAEAVAPVLGRPAARLGGKAKKVQTVLGEHEDSVLARTLLLRLATTATQTFTYGLLYAAEQQHAAASAQQFTDLWRRADDTARQRLLPHLGRHHG